MVQEKIVRYTVWLEEYGYSPATISVYHILLERAFRSRSIAQFISKLPANRKRYYYTVLSGFSLWLKREGHKELKLPALDRLPPSANPRRVHQAPAEGEVRCLVAEARKRSHQIAAAVQVLAQTGLRVSEFCGINIADYLAEDNPPTLLIRGKGAKARLVPLAKAVVTAIEQQALDDEDLTGDEPLFVNTVGERWKPRAIQSQLERLSDDAEIRKITPHDLRRYFASRLDAVGTRPRLIQELMGHSNITTTMHYVSVRPEEVNKAYEQAFH